MATATAAAAHVRRTKIVATIGPASRSPDVIRELIRAGMNVARLNFSHGSYEDHAKTVQTLRTCGEECDNPVTILQDLQGPKVRIGTFAEGQITLARGETLTLLPVDQYKGQPGTAPIDYPLLAAEARAGNQILLDDGLLELRVEEIVPPGVRCTVVEGGTLKSRKGVILPNVDLSIPSMTEKDKQDLAFGVSQGVDWVALSFVRRARDVQELKDLLASMGKPIPVLAKIEKPEAVERIDEILEVVDGLMVARGDLGVEMRPEQVPMTQKKLIRACNARGIPVITATQMLESMINEPRPTRAEASDVANAVVDGTDCVMLSGESAVGKYPVGAVQMMSRIAAEVEPSCRFTDFPPARNDETHALSRAIDAVDAGMELRCIATFTTTGYSARLVSGQRPRVPVIAITPHARTFHSLNLHWGVKPVLTAENATTFEQLLDLTERVLLSKRLVAAGDKVLIVAGLPMGQTGGTNLIKIHTVKGG